MVEFSRGGAVRVGRQPYGASRGLSVVLRARSRLGEQRYDVVRNNGTIAVGTRGSAPPAQNRMGLEGPCFAAACGSVQTNTAAHAPIAT
jgi:hypothetical protein